MVFYLVFPFYHQTFGQRQPKKLNRLFFISTKNIFCFHCEKKGQNNNNNNA